MAIAQHHSKLEMGWLNVIGSYHRWGSDLKYIFSPSIPSIQVTYIMLAGGYIVTRWKQFIAGKSGDVVSELLLCIANIGWCDDGKKYDIENSNMIIGFPIMYITSRLRQLENWELFFKFVITVHSIRYTFRACFEVLPLRASPTPDVELDRTSELRGVSFTKRYEPAVQIAEAAKAQFHKMKKRGVPTNYKRIPPRSRKTIRETVPRRLWDARLVTIPSERTWPALLHTTIQGGAIWAASIRPKLVPNRPIASQLGQIMERSYERCRTNGIAR